MGGSSKHVLPVYLDGAKQTIAPADFTANVADWNGLTSSVQVNNGIGTPSKVRLGVPNHYGTVVFVVSKDTNTSVQVSDYTSGSDSIVKTLNAANESITLMYNGSDWVEIAGTEASVPTIAYADLSGKPDTDSGFGLKERTKEYSATIAYNGIDGSVTAYTAGDSLFRFPVQLSTDVSTDHAGGVKSHILVHDVMVAVKTATGVDLECRLELHNANNVQDNASVGGVKLNGTSSGVQEGETRDTFNLNETGIFVQRTEAVCGSDDINLYLVTETALNANVTAGAARVLIRYTVL